jgi:protein-disulfide isomerase
MYALGPESQLVVSSPKESSVEGLMEVTVTLKTSGNTENVQMYVSKDGKFLIRGDIADLSKDPLAGNRDLLDIKDSPALGNANAPVTIVEFSDFQCPVCRALHDSMRDVLAHHQGQIRLIFKDYPIEQLHPWARTAALAGRCAYQQQPAAFWKVYDAIYDGQDLISPSNAWNKMLDFAEQAGLNADTFKACMAAPEPGAAIDASKANGQKLEITSTPTVFVNGRRMIGADPRMLEQFVQYELAQKKTTQSKN